MSVATVFTILEIIGFVSFAISGAIVAIDKELDIVGVLFLAVVTCFGGGMIRDVMLRQIPLFFTSYELVTLVLATALIVFVLALVFKKKYVENEGTVNYVNNYVDAVGLGVFVVLGMKICMSYGVTNPFILITMGIMTGCGGGVIRDVTIREVPFVFRKRVYVVAALLGAGLYCILTRLEVNDTAAMPLSVAIIVAVRVLATIFRLNLPRAIDFEALKSEGEKTEK